MSIFFLTSFPACCIIPLVATIFRKRKKFGELAVKKGFITARQLKLALVEQGESDSRSRTHKKIGAILLEKGFIGIDDIGVIVKEQQKSTFWTWTGAFFSLKRSI